MILITSPHPDFTKKAYDIIKESDMDITIVESILDAAVNDVQDMLDTIKPQKVEIIISRGGTADFLKGYFNLPIISADVTDFDVLKAFWDAKYYSDNIGYLGYKDDQKLYDFYLISQILKVEIQSYPYKDINEIYLQLDKAKKQGVQVIIVGNHLAENYAKQLGLKVILVKSSERSIREALFNAKELINAFIQEKYFSCKLQTIMDLSKEGIITIENEGIISYVNSAAERILRIKRDQLIDNNIKNTFLNKLFETDITDYKNNLIRFEDIDIQHLFVNYMPLIINNEQRGIVISFSDIKDIQQMEHKIRKELFKQGIIAKYTFSDIVGCSKSIMETIKVAKQFGLSNHTIIINGETGTGKELFAQSIHNVSARKDYPFVSVNCGAFPENLLDSELFGYVEGAFTGALKGGKVGLIELAQDGTMFLDEIDKMPMGLQIKLLRVIQERQIRPIGSNKIIPVDIRFIAATNRNLIDLINKKQFLSDLYYRLNVLSFKIPTLKDRKDDIPLLIRYICNKHSPTIPYKIFSQHILDKFFSYEWPGNVRELENLVNRYITLKISQVKEGEMYKYFPEFELEKDNEKFIGHNQSNEISLKLGPLKEMEKQLMLKMLEYFNGNKTALGEYLGISRNTIARIINRN